MEVPLKAWNRNHKDRQKEKVNIYDNDMQYETYHYQPYEL